jgi:cell fate regulator YaaT (PSP1 superfamily)
VTEVISIKFRNAGKVYYFDPNGLVVNPGDHVIVETAKGLEYGECTAGNHEVEDSAIVPPLRPAIRIATEEDRKIAAQNAEKEKKAFEICQQKIEAHGLEMKLVDVEYSFDGSKILFFFTADGRVDFRELVKDLVSVFRVRIELRQIGVRDGAKMLGGLGICGRPFCCSTFLDEFHPVSIKMAKTQSLSLNPTKISGTCGRLMCCLKYEQEAYEDLIKNAPKVSASVVTPFGEGIVTEVNLLKQIAKVRVDEGDTAGLHIVPFCDIGKTVSCVPKKEEPAPVLLDTSILDRFIYLSDKPSVRETPVSETSGKAPAGEAAVREAKPEPQTPPKPEQRASKQPRPISELSMKPAAPEGSKPQEAKKNNRRRGRDKRKTDKSGSKLLGVIEELEQVVKPASGKPGRKKNRRKPKPPIAEK